MKTKTRRIIAMLLFSVVLVSMGMGSVCSAASWKTMRLSSYNTKNYTSSTFVSQGDVLLQLEVYQNTSNISQQASYATVETQRKDNNGQWITVNSYFMSLKMGQNGIATHLIKNIENLGGTCRLVFTSDETVKIGGSIQYFN